MYASYQRKGSSRKAQIFYINSPFAYVFTKKRKLNSFEWQFLHVINIGEKKTLFTILKTKFMLNLIFVFLATHNGNFNIKQGNKWYCCIQQHILQFLSHLSTVNLKRVIPFSMNMGIRNVCNHWIAWNAIECSIEKRM